MVAPDHQHVSAGKRVGTDAESTCYQGLPSYRKVPWYIYAILFSRNQLAVFHMRGVSSPHNWMNSFLCSCFCACFCRHLGSAKFGSFLFLAAVLSKSIELALCVQFPFLRPPLGPLAILSAVAMTYYGERRGRNALLYMYCM